MYCTLDDLERRYGHDAILILADRDGDGEADAGLTDEAIADTTAEIDSYLAARYSLPLPQVSPVLARLACDMAYYRLASAPGAATEEMRTRYDDAVALLRRISSGEVSLGLPAPEPTPVQAAPGLVSGGRGDFKRWRP